MLHGERPAGQRHGRDRPASHLAFRRHQRHAVPVAQPRREQRGDLAADLLHRRQRTREPAQHGERGDEVRTLPVETEGGAQRRQRQLAGTERATKRVLGQTVDEVTPANHDAGLRAPEELVAAEGDEIGTRSDPIPHDRLVRQAECREIDERAASEVLDHRHPALPPDRHERCELDSCRVAHEPVVARVDLQEERRRGAERASVVVGMGAVGRAHLAETRPTLRHHVGETERATDLDQLAAGNDHLALGGQGVEDEEHRGRVVVDDERGLGPGERREILDDEVVTLASPAGPEVQLQVGRPPGG